MWQIFRLDGGGFGGSWCQFAGNGCRAPAAMRGMVAVRLSLAGTALGGPAGAADVGGAGDGEEDGEGWGAGGGELQAAAVGVDEGAGQGEAEAGGAGAGDAALEDVRGEVV